MTCKGTVELGKKVHISDEIDRVFLTKIDCTGDFDCTIDFSHFSKKQVFRR